MAQQHHQGGPVYKEEPGTSGTQNDQHHSHHAQQGGPPPPQHLGHPRPSSIVHHQQAPPPQHPNAYPSVHGLPQHQYGQPAPAAGHHPQEINQYYGQPSPYSTPSATGTYSAASETPEIMAAAQMSRPVYPPIYQTPQSNSPASVASPAGHDQHGRSIYGQPGPHMQQQQQQQQQQHMYYPPPQQQSQYPLPPQGGPSPYGQHPQQQQAPMNSQPNSMLISHQTGQHPMQHPSQHQQQPNMTSSPRPKMEHVPQLQRPPTGPLGPPQQHPQQNGGPPMNSNNVPGNGVNPNAAPGPIPATTPLVVRQDGNGVQWIAFEYSRDRVKMEYTIRCDVESVNVDTLSPEFKTENCVYPRACCSKDQYRGNRLVYETECNTVGWALAELNPSLRGKRGLIQRAVDSWRNSNQDPRLRSRRVRRMAKINTRKAVQAATHMPGPGAPAGMPPSGNMGPSGGAGSMGKPGLGNMGGPQLHHHHAHPDPNAPGGPDDSTGDDSYIDENTHHHHHTANGSGPPPGPPGHGEDIRHAQNFSPYPGSYPAPSNSSNGPSMPPSIHDNMVPQHMSAHPSSNAIAAKGEEDSDSESLFGNVPEDKKRKFILVQDDVRSQRSRVRVTLDTIDPKEIPDSYRKSNSVYPRSWFPMQMQDPPPSARGSRFFEEDDDDSADANGTDGPSGRGKTMVPITFPDGNELSLSAPRMRKTQREKEVKLNELGYRMTWLQTRVFAGRTVFLQKSLDSYRNKNRSTMETSGQDVAATFPHFETRAGKRKLLDRTKREKREGDI